ncbi:MAG: NAD-dependent protein deacylase [Clostridiales bacterium]|uniref:NAD-dependent protein deacylase n=1 Tax=Clostridium sp. N3C TaxID=1776758 RepID=UPI00092E1182|nr:NAD-dependent protein deacylase [Clostridium sp. N3C]NLZ48025.1 NAD-dependent protein deacylase [Clostridiales bacterium]SCN24178.1 NAD-dependent protein deacetylase [Clostridium sp. N3C]
MSLDNLKKVIKESDNIVFFGGAGVSTESNIPDFRSASGLYNEKTQSKYSPEEILSHDFFMEHTEEFYDFYKSKMIYVDAKPNDAHLVLAELEKMGKLKAVITQNIDGLHQSAGSKEVLELHGSVHRNYCTKCHKFFGLDYIIKSKGIPLCEECGGIIKPDVVLYGENLDMDVLHRSIDYIAKSQVLIVAGTSLTVYPAAGLIRYFKGKELILINKTPTPYDKLAHIVINDSVGKTLRNVL